MPHPEISTIPQQPDSGPSDGDGPQAKRWLRSARQGKEAEDIEQDSSRNGASDGEAEGEEREKEDQVQALF